MLRYVGEPAYKQGTESGGSTLYRGTKPLSTICGTAFGQRKGSRPSKYAPDDEEDWQNWPGDSWLVEPRPAA